MNLYLVKGTHPKGRAQCGCMMRKNESYFIKREIGELHSKCSTHTEVGEQYRVIEVPEDLNKQGVIPII